MPDVKDGIALVHDWHDGTADVIPENGSMISISRSPKGSETTARSSPFRTSEPSALKIRSSPPIGARTHLLDGQNWGDAFGL